ncbi:hypothetical protein GGH94_004014 [Coemansia aciculifera]|uniref:Uncharacterized protein n=1 Tax=Coemansia aciculifera TaxID=417176 RepID=A0A9W8IMP6_9FUNG|nr:hypothetical protein GGH94_004014 [Coemansia aciculifera]
MLVAEKIVEYLEGRLRNAFDDDIDKHNETKKILHLLLSVGKVVFDNARGVFEVNYPAWPAGVSYLRFLRDKLVKQVIVTAPGWKDMFDKNSSETIAWSQYNGAIFSSATTLVVKLNRANSFSHSAAAKLDAGASRNEIDSLARSIRRLAPAVTGMSVVAISVDATHKSHRELLYGMSGLTSITHGGNVPCSPIARLAYLNASTLKELRILPATQGDWDSLIKCGKKSPAVYTSLVSLSMDIANTFSAQSWTTIEGLVPLPVLAKLAISGVYPLDDDTLFRGNGRTLRNLRLPFDAIARNTLGRFNVLEHSGITQVSSIHIVQTPDTYEPISSEDFVGDQIHRMLETSPILKLGCDMASGNMSSILCNAPRTAIPQHLTLFDQFCSIGDIISIVSALLSLVSLTTEIRGSATRIGLIPESEHPGILHKMYYPLSSNFSVACTECGKY